MMTEPRATYLVKRLESAVRRNLDLELGSHGMTTPQYAALSILRAQPGLSSAQLARRAFVTPQSMQVMVTAFIRDGLVERRTDPSNQRILRNHLTATASCCCSAPTRSRQGSRSRCSAGWTGSRPRSSASS